MQLLYFNGTKVDILPVMPTAIEQYMSDITQAFGLVKASIDAQIERIGNVSHDYLTRELERIEKEVRESRFTSADVNGVHVVAANDDVDEPLSPKMMAIKKLQTFNAYIDDMVRDKAIDVDPAALGDVKKVVVDAMMQMNGHRVVCGV